MVFEVVAIVGVGLIGGSIGKAVKARGLARRVRGAGRQQASLDRARDVGAVDETYLLLDAAVRGADLVIFCTPVDRIAPQILETSFTAGTLITDAGSTKANIVRALDGRLAAGVTFVGSHPLAGSEKRGPEHADARLFQDRWTVVTPTAETPASAVERIEAFWQALGSRTLRLAPEEHDSALALTSHLPHLLASALASLLGPDTMNLAASGFRDTTRIAASDPELWTAIFGENRAAVLAALSNFERQLGRYRAALETKDPQTLRELLAQGKKVRDALGS